MKFEMGILGVIFVSGLFFFTPQASATVRMVYPDGSGDFPLIQSAVDASVDGDTVMLTDGTFTGRGNMDIRYNGNKITVCSQSGNAQSCIVDVAGEANGIAERGFIFDNNEDSLSILKDLTIINGSADALCPGCEGAGVYIYYSSPSIINVICHDNYALNGAAIMCVGGSAIIRNCQLINNTASEGAGLMCLDSTRVTLSKCLIAGNSADLRGGGISLQAYCALTLLNCTISNNQSNEGSGIAAWDCDYVINNTIISFNDSATAVFAYGESHIMISYSDIFGNLGGDWTDSIANQLGINGNIEANPLYFDVLNGDFHLTQYSPCVDTGDPNSPHDPDGTIADMGAFYFDHFAAVSDLPSLPKQSVLNQNYPNPFNSTTKISFSLSSSGQTLVKVFDVAGREIAILLNGYLDIGVHSSNWDGKNSAGESVGSGLYFYSVKSGNFSGWQKMTLLK
jgi:hypothetical protein